MAGNLKALCSILRKHGTICDHSRIPGEFQVLNIFAYIADATFLKSLTPPVTFPSQTAILLHDVIITDGVDKLKCLLALPLSDLVQKHILKIGSYIQINSAKFFYDDTRFDNRIVTYVIFEDIKVVERAILTFPDLTRLQFLESHSTTERELVPLATSRKCYVHVWFAADPYGRMWLNDPDPITFKDNDPVPLGLQKLEDVMREWQRMPQPLPPLILRVLYRGYLHNFADNVKDNVLPFRGNFIVGDETGYVHMVSFGLRNPEFCINAVPDTILLIENYVLQEPTFPQKFPSLIGSLRNLTRFSPQIMIRNSSRVRIILNNCNTFSQEIALLPPVEYKFVTIASLENVADKDLVDIVCLITYVSRFERYRNYRHNLYVSYWIEAIDRSSHLPIRILVFANAHRLDHSSLHPGRILVATQMVVCHVPDYAISDPHATFYLVSSTFSELYINHQGKTYCRMPEVIDICNLIRDSVEEVDYLRNNVLRIGGRVCYPPLPLDFESYKRDLENIHCLKLEPDNTWGDLFKNLRFRERIRFSIKGLIVRVDYVDIQTVRSDGPAYGWSYTHGAKSRPIFFDIRRIEKLKYLPEPPNMAYFNKFFFPQKYTSERKEELLRYRDFPPTNVEDWMPPVGDTVQTIPFQGDGYYLITIVSLHFENFIECILIPEPAMAPYPTFLELLSGQYQLAPLRKVKTFISEPPRYTRNELRQIERTVQRINGRIFLFALEAFCPAVGQYEAFIRRGYLCSSNGFEFMRETDT